MTGANTIPQAPFTLPLLGNILPLIRDPLAFLRSLPAHGDLVRVRVGPVSAVVVCTAELTRRVLVDDRTFDKGGMIYERAREILGDALITCSHDRHRRQRRLVQPAFHPARLSGYAEVMSARIDELTGRWAPGQELDVLPEMLAITFETLVSTMFSDTLPAATLHQVFDDLGTTITGSYRRMLTPPPLDRLPTKANRRYHEATERLRAVIAGIVTDRRASTGAHDDLLSMLLTATDDGGKLSDEELCNVLLTIFNAGAETTATVLAWALHLVAADEDVQRQLREEVDFVLGDRVASYEDLPRLPLTSRVIAEVLRLYPPTWILSRVVTTDTELGGHRLPAGLTVFFSPYLVQRDPGLFPEPDRFLPDRWEQSSAPGTTVAFGGGARKCVGDQFGLVEATLALATITARWRVEPADGTTVRPASAMILRPGALRMRATPRIPAKWEGS